MHNQDLNDEARLYPRYQLHDARLATAEITGRPGVLGEIAYGGCSIVFDGGAPRNLFPGRVADITLEVVGVVHTLRARVVSVTADGAHLCFEHDMADDLAFLREVLPWIEAGAACVPEPGAPEGHARDEGERRPKRQAEARLGEDEQGRWGVWLRVGRITYAAVDTGNGFQTMLDLAPGAERGPMRVSARLDPTIIRRALLVVHGAWLAIGDEKLLVAKNRLLAVLATHETDHRKLPDAV